MIANIAIKDIMTKGIVTARPTDSVLTISRMLKAAGIGAVVITEGHDIKGILTEGDIIRKVVSLDKKPGDLQAKDIMTSPVRSIDDDLDIEEASRIMRDLRVERLPVARNEKLVGIITQNDLTRIEPALHVILREERELRAMKGEEYDRLFSGICENCNSAVVDDLKITEDKRLLCSECRGETS